MYATHSTAEAIAKYVYGSTGRNIAPNDIANCSNIYMLDTNTCGIFSSFAINW